MPILLHDYDRIVTTLVGPNGNIEYMEAIVLYMQYAVAKQVLLLHMTSIALFSDLPIEHSLMSHKLDSLVMSLDPVVNVII